MIVFNTSMYVGTDYTLEYMLSVVLSEHLYNYTIGQYLIFQICIYVGSSLGFKIEK